MVATLLGLMGLPQPKEMTGRALVRFGEQRSSGGLDSPDERRQELAVALAVHARHRRKRSGESVRLSIPWWPAGLPLVGCDAPNDRKLGSETPIDSGR